MMILRAVLASIPLSVATAVLLLGPAGLVAGAWAWPRGWAFVAVYALLSAGGWAVLARVRPASYAVRQQGLVARQEKRQPLIDALGLVLFTVCLASWLAFIPVDVFRLHLLSAPSAEMSAAGGLAAIVGLVVAYTAIGQNQFAAPTIHDQSGDGQRTIQTGLYGLVRHPFYAGMLLLYAGAALWLGSYAAVIGVALFLLLTLARIVIEESWLRQNLPDYADYARRVRGRLIPFVL